MAPIKITRAFSSLCAGATLCGLLAWSAPSSADDAPGYPEDIDAYDPREVAMLPRFCLYTLEFRDKAPGGGGNDPAEIERWYATMGPTFHHMHHYCWALMHTNRALFIVKSTTARTFHLEVSIGDLDYVLDRATPDFIMLADVLAKKGQNLIRLGKGPAGVMELQRAINAKPDYLPAYAILSDYYKANGAPAKAREILKEGLSIAPEAGSLKRRLVELDSTKGKQKALR